MSAFLMHGLTGIGLPWILAAIAMAGLYGLVSRKVGQKDVKNARSIGFPAVVIASAVLLGLPGLLAGAGWCVTRSEGFSKDAATPTKLKHFLSASFRLVPVWAAAAINFLYLAEPYALWGAAAVTIAQLAWAAWYGDENAEAEAAGQAIDPKANVRVEWGQGLAAGAAIAISLGLGGSG